MSDEEEMIINPALTKDLETKSYGGETGLNKLRRLGLFLLVSFLQ